jgi:tRNA-Thr(GGU) m(6)t(6)A37 methyltransferase TsaA
MVQQTKIEAWRNVEFAGPSAVHAGIEQGNRTVVVAAEVELRPGEVAIELPAQTDAGIYFIGTIHTPWRTRSECPKRGSPDGPVCSIVVAERWRPALTDLAAHPRIQVLYWMHRARRDLVLQTPARTGQTTGCFALRSPMRPNPIASSVVDLVAIEGGTLRVRGLDCIDGTPLVDLKPDRGKHIDGV